jgi:hypothetical protein
LKFHLPYQAIAVATLALPEFQARAEKQMIGSYILQQFQPYTRVKIDQEF